MSTLSSAMTRGVRVRVQSRYLPQRSDPQAGEWFFVYTVRIANESEEIVQLLTRHWVIQDGAGREQHVRGPGVVGAQPVLEPGQAFEYTSFCPLPTPSGQMHGSFAMVTKGGESFDAEVAPFALSEEQEFC